MAQIIGLEIKKPATETVKKEQPKEQVKSAVKSAVKK